MNMYKQSKTSIWLKLYANTRDLWLVQNIQLFTDAFFCTILHTGVPLHTKDTISLNSEHAQIGLQFPNSVKLLFHISIYSSYPMYECM